ncbi:hypothetical protein AB4383_08010 [Vibrio breoganii]
MNEFLSSVLSFANTIIFVLVVVITGILVYSGGVEFFYGFLAIAGAVIVCGLVATLMEIKGYLMTINDKLYKSNRITLSIHEKLGDDEQN